MTGVHKKVKGHTFLNKPAAESELMQILELISCHCSLSIPSSKRKFKGYRKIPYGMKLVNGLHSYAPPGVLSDPLTKSMIIKVGI